MKQNRPQRIEQALSQSPYNKKTTAEKCGITVYAIANYIKGRRKPPVDFLIRFAEVTGVSFEWLALGNRASRSIDEFAKSRIDGRADQILEKLKQVEHDVRNIKKHLNKAPKE